MRIDALATLPHYLDHIVPIWNNLPEEVLGSFYVPSELMTKAARQLSPGVDLREATDIRPSGDVCLVAGFSDIQNSGGRRHILMEHGIGQSYFPFTNPAYAGGMGRESVELFLCPNEYCAKLNRDRYPEAKVSIIGSPRLEQLMGLERKNGGRTVAFGFHFDLMLCEETRNAWSHFSSGISDVMKSGWEVLGHAHPRIFRDLAPTYKDMGVEPVKDFDEIVERADVYIFDNSSTGFEFAAAVGPVVVMNAPWYRKNVDHGLRFWEAANVGPQVTDPFAIVPAIDLALAGWKGKEDALDKIFSPVEDPSNFAVEVILDTLKIGPTKKARHVQAFPKTSTKIYEEKILGS